MLRSTKIGDHAGAHRCECDTQGTDAAGTRAGNTCNDQEVLTCIGRTEGDLGVASSPSEAGSSSIRAVNCNSESVQRTSTCKSGEGKCVLTSVSTEEVGIASEVSSTGDGAGEED